MTHSILKTTTSLSLAAMVMFSMTSPVLAQGNKAAAHSQAYGQTKKTATTEFAPSASNSPSEVNASDNGIQSRSTEAHDKAQDNRVAMVDHKVSNNTQHNSIKTADVQGYNGTVKVGNYVLGNGPDGNPGNRPHLPCTFQIEAYNYDAGVTKVNYVITSHPPTQLKFEVIKSGSFDLDKDDNSYGASDRGFDGKVVLNLTEALKPYSAHEKQGYHVKVEVTFEGQVSQGAKSKVFWIEKCENPVIPGTTTPQDEQGETLSTNTTKPVTAVMGTSIERSTGEALPYTGGNGTAAAQAFGLSLMALGGAIAWGKRVAVQCQY
jgi:LPXTG-motif cell wall-anchored protein